MEGSHSSGPGWSDVRELANHIDAVERDVMERAEETHKRITAIMLQMDEVKQSIEDLPALRGQIDAQVCEHGRHIENLRAEIARLREELLG